MLLKSSCFCLAYHLPGTIANANLPNTNHFENKSAFLVWMFNVHTEFLNKQLSMFTHELLEQRLPPIKKHNYLIAMASNRIADDFIG